MTVQISIIGLGQIGGSIGLALANQKELVLRVGHDRDPGIARKAKEKGALDKADFNLYSAIREADLVILALPADQVRETMELVAKDMKENAVLMDTAPAKEIVSRWAQELLPEGRYFVGLTPVLNSAYLHDVDSGLEAARADLFQGSLIGIVSPPGTPAEAIKLGADLARLLGAAPLFSDPMEMDGLMAATHLLPQLLAAGLLNATLDQPGWRDSRKVAGRAYAEATGPIVHLNSAKTLASAVMFNRDNTLRMLNAALASLIAIRNDLDANDQSALEERLERARSGRETWWRQRKAGDWLQVEGMPAPEMPTASELFGRLIGLRKKTKK